MAETIPKVDNSSLFGLNLSDIFLGKTTTQNQTGGSVSTSGGSQTTSGGSQTTSEEVSSDKANALVKSILEGTSGLANVASGEKTAGMYNSTVNTQLINDLISRTAGQVASASKTTTQTITPQTVTKSPTTETKAPTTLSTRVNPQVPSSTALAGLIGLQLAPKELKDKISGALGLGNTAKTVGSGIMNSNTSAGVAKTVAEQDAAYSAASGASTVSSGAGVASDAGLGAAAGGSIIDTGADLGGVDVAGSIASVEPANLVADTGLTLASAATNAADATDAVSAASSASDALSAGADAGDFAALDVGSDLGSAAFDAGADAGADVALDFASEGVPYASFLRAAPALFDTISSLLDDIFG